MFKSNKIAHVGACPDNTRPLLDIAFKWLMKNDSSCLSESLVHDYIDLNEGRDFLTEDKTYGIVILHYLYNPPFKEEIRETGFFAISPFHTKERWQERIVSTNAKHVFAIGSFGEVGGEYLGVLDGYSKTIYDEMTTIYSKNNSDFLI